MFVLSLDAAGDLMRAGMMGGTGADQANAVVVDDEGALYVAGWFASTADLDPGPGVQSHTSVGGADGFLIKVIEVDPANVHELSSSGSLRVHPNPTSDRFTLHLDTDVMGQRGVIEIFDASGARLHAEALSKAMPMWSFELPSEWTDGLYMVVLRAEGQYPKTARLVLQR